VNLWTGPLARASRLSACGAHLWMLGWTTLRVAHAPSHRPPAAHELHGAPSPFTQRQEQNRKALQPAHPSRTRTSPKRRCSHPTKTTPSLQSSSRNPATDRNRSRSRNDRSRSPKYATHAAAADFDETKPHA
jgi:hypothetical protein